MFIPSTPPRNPALTVEPSRASSRYASVPTHHTGSRQGVPEPPRRRDNEGFGRPSQRPMTPLVDSAGVVNETVHAECSLSRKTSKSSSVPPPVNRAEKPKIFAKKPSVATPPNTKSATLAPMSQRTSLEENGVSPFSTPPSSPEKATPSKLANDHVSKHARSPSHLLDPSAARRPKIEPPPFISPHRTKPSLPEPRVPAFSRETKPSIVSQRPVTQQPSQAAASVRRTATLPSKRQDTPSRFIKSDDPVDRPGLPPRLQEVKTRRGPPWAPPSLRTAGTEPVSASSHRAPPLLETEPRRSLQLPPSGRPNVTFPPPPRRDSGKPQAENPSPIPQPPRSPSQPPELLNTSPAAVLRHVTKVARDEVAEQPQQEPIRVEEAPVSRMDYPDASHTNRRPPFFKTGTRAIHTKHDTRAYDVCGQYVCTTGFNSRAWDLVTGEQIMSMSHSESQKGTAVAFKPGRAMEEEGKLIWVGTNTGELMEIDVATQSIVTSRTSPSRREIVKIYRHQKDFWTLDDEGRLLLWPPDESGTPNLQYSYSNPYDKVPKGHTFSMVVGDVLWYATGKELRLYRPNMNDSSFQVLQSPLGKNHSGDITSGTSTTKDGGRVYLGHADGKVTIYSTKDYTCIGQVNVSLYKISALSMVGDYLWAGYKTGMVYVYDTTTNPWTVKKDWLAHDHGVVGMVVDLTGIWTVNRLQVVSLGVDNHIRFWDGMLEDDWLGMFAISV